MRRSKGSKLAAATTARRPVNSRRGKQPLRGANRRPQLHIGRLLALVLVLIAAAFYLGPLREFFAQQDRYQQATAALDAAQADNTALNHEVELLSSDSYIGQQALAGSMLVPPDTQVFVIKGLPGREAEDAALAGETPQADSISALDRVEDLWRTLLN
ncbi:MAG: septum formation initiator family protein [Thermoleophilia bacterium]